MNRLIENRYKIKMVKTQFNTINVDNFADFKKAKRAMNKDKYFNLYNNNI
jgi:hypothetical protein